MSRTVTSGVNTNLQGEHVWGAYLIQMNFGSGIRYATNAAYQIVWNGNTYTSIAGQVDEIKESITGEVIGLKFSVSGTLSDLIAEALAEDFKYRDVFVYFATFDPTTLLVTSDPVLEWQGKMDQLTINDDVTNGQTQIILSAESRVVAFQRPAIRRHNMEDHHRDFPGDLFYQYVPQMVEATIVWPSADFFKQK